MVGGPGSGKSTYATSKLPTYKLVSNEQLKTKQNCIKALKEHLAAGDSVVIDLKYRMLKFGRPEFGIKWI